MFALLRGNSAPEPDEVQKILMENGWEKGLVCFGLLASENVVKVATAISLLMKQDSFPYKSCKFVELKMTSQAALVTGSDGSQSMGVYSDTWALLSGGRCCMPGVAIDGKMYLDSAMILEHLWSQYPDRTLPRAGQAEVKRLLEMNTRYTERLQQALKHWGWCAMYASRPNYKELGPGNKDLAWERETVKFVDTFFQTLEEHIRQRKVDGFFGGYLVGQKLTLADCAFINWPTSFSLVLGMDVENRYPLSWENSEMLKALAPAGSEDFYGTFPIFCTINGMMNMANRGTWCFCCTQGGRGFYIENPVYWE